MNTTVQLTKKQAWPIVSQVFPQYRGRKFRLEFTSQVGFYDTNWSGGTRSYYAAVRADGKHARLPEFAPWANPIEGKKIDLPVEVLVVEHTHFCGQDCGIIIYANPQHLPKWITAQFKQGAAICAQGQPVEVRPVV